MANRAQQVWAINKDFPVSTQTHNGKRRWPFKIMIIYKVTYLVSQHQPEPNIKESHFLQFRIFLYKLKRIIAHAFIFFTSSNIFVVLIWVCTISNLMSDISLLYILSFCKKKSVNSISDHIVNVFRTYNIRVVLTWFLCFCTSWMSDIIMLYIEKNLTTSYLIIL